MAERATEEDFNAHGYWSGIHGLPFHKAEEVACRGMAQLLENYLKQLDEFTEALSNKDIPKAEALFNALELVSPKNSMMQRITVYQLNKAKALK